MKSEERHQLQENTLIHLLESGAEKVRPYTTLIFGGISVLLGAMIVWSVWSQRQAAKTSEAWDQYEVAMTRQDDIERSDLLDLATSEQFGGSMVSEWAYLAYADRQLRQAAEFYLVNREASLDRLEEVANIYQQLAKGAATQDLRDRARLGLARVLEMQNKPDEAREAYVLITGPLSNYAAERAEQLDSPSAKAAADWLATADLPSSSLPNSPGTPGARPDFETLFPPTDGATDAGGGLDPDTMRSLEDVFGGAGAEGADRYGEAEEADGASADGASDDATTSDADSAEQSNDESGASNATETAGDGSAAEETE